MGTSSLKQASATKLGTIRTRALEGFNKHRTLASTFSFALGFTWDSMTLTRIDRLIDNIIFLSYLFLLALFILLHHASQKDLFQSRPIKRFREWYPLAVQFFLGGLMSGYVVFYFQSAAITKNWLFMGFLVFLLLANEFFEQRMSHIVLHLVLFFLASFSFCIFFFPVITKIMNTPMFLASGVASLIPVALLVYFFHRAAIFRKKQTVFISVLISLLFIGLNTLYFLNWIPPVPLALRTGGAFHHVEREGNTFLCTFENPPWYFFWKKSDTVFSLEQDQSVYCFTAVFAPTELTKNIYHDWQYFNPRTREWKTTDHIGYEIVGGRDEGYRGYTFKSNISPGKWRVEVVTGDGRIISRIGFTIVSKKTKTRALSTINL